MTAPRRSITKAQLETAVGLELCQLLEEITDDGRLGIEEVNKLHDWLMENQSAELPAVAHLLPVMARIAEDGQVSPDELVLLQNEIEAVLPVDLRQFAKFKRKHARAKERAAEQEAKAEAKAESDLQKPVARFDVMVAGAHHHGNAEASMAGAAASLVLEPDNPHDRNAVAVMVRGLRVGYLPRDEAAHLAPLLRMNNHEAQIKKVLEGGRGPIPVVAGAIYRPEAKRGAPSGLQSFGDTSAKGGNGCAIAFVVFLIVGMLCFVSACQSLLR